MASDHSAQVPRFFFQFPDGHEVPDDMGIELPHLDAARLEAIRGIRSLVADYARKGRVPLSERLHIEDESGQLLLAVPFSEAVKIE